MFHLKIKYTNTFSLFACICERRKKRQLRELTRKNMVDTSCEKKIHQEKLRFNFFAQKNCAIRQLPES